MKFEAGDVVRLKEVQSDFLLPQDKSTLMGEFTVEGTQVLSTGTRLLSLRGIHGDWLHSRFELVRRAGAKESPQPDPMVSSSALNRVRDERDAMAKHVTRLAAERDAERQRANGLADECGRFRDEDRELLAENRELLAENARLRRQLERLGGK